MGITGYIFLFIVLIIAAYLLGSISPAVYVSKNVYGKDIRDMGSFNAGANNIQRNFGWKAGLFVLIVDIAKGSAAACLVFLIPGIKQETDAFVGAQIIFGFAAIMGHIFPIFHKFKGGKGVSTFCGALLAIHPFAVLLCFILFLIVFFLTRYISLGVIAAVTCFPLLVNFLFAMWLDPKETLTLKIFSIVAGLTIWLTHISNIKRLLNGTEQKFVLRKPQPTLH